MAVYFDYNKKIPHINFDDVYVVSGDVKDDYLILSYSIPEIDPISISLSGFDNFDYINSARFSNNNIIFTYNRNDLPDLSVDLTKLDKHVNEIVQSEDKKVLSLCFNDGTFISTDTTKYVENFFLSTWCVDNKNLILSYNTDSIQPISIDLDQTSNKLISAKIIDNTLSLADKFGNSISADLEKFSYNDFIDDYTIDAANQLILKYSTQKASGHAEDLSIDLARIARNYYIKNAHLDEEELVLDYNTAEAGENLSVSLATLNNYIKKAEIMNNVLIFTYNSDRIPPLKVNIKDFVKDWYIKDVKLCENNLLKFTYNVEKPELHIDPVDLTKYDDHIENIVQNKDNDTVQFIRTNGKTLPTLNLSKYLNNDIVSMHLHGNSLVLKFANNSTKDVSLDHFDKYVISGQIIDEKLFLFYNDNKGHLSVDIPDKYVDAAKIQNDNLVLKYNFDVPSLSVNLSDYTRNDYIESIEYDDASSKLIFKFNKPTYFEKRDDLSVEITTVKFRHYE